jgi:hypothetical protein
MRAKAMRAGRSAFAEAENALIGLGGGWRPRVPMRFDRERQQGFA